MPYAARHRNLWCPSQRVPPHMLLSVVLAHSYSRTAWNQSEGKGFVTPSFFPSHCDMTLEKIDQERYFWSQLSITLPSDLQSANILCDSRSTFVSSWAGFPFLADDFKVSHTVPRITSSFKFNIFCSDFQAEGGECLKQNFPSSEQTLGTFKRYKSSERNP